MIELPDILDFREFVDFIHPILMEHGILVEYDGIGMSVEVNGKKRDVLHPYSWCEPCD